MLAVIASGIAAQVAAGTNDVGFDLFLLVR